MENRLIDVFGWDPPVTNGIGGDPPSDGGTIPDSVEQVIITASKGGGRAVTITYGFYDNFMAGPDAGLDDFTNYVSFAQGDAESFANSHLHGTPGSEAYQRAKELIMSLYTLAKLNTTAGINTTFAGPNGHTLTWPEILTSLDKTQFYIGAFQAYNGSAYNAFTDIRGDSSKVYIDDAKMASYVTEFGLEKGYNYVLYHEFAHASLDGRSEASNPNREAITNEYGQMLAELNGALYPSDNELSPVGGTVPR